MHKNRNEKFSLLKLGKNILYQVHTLYAYTRSFTPVTPQPSPMRPIAKGGWTQEASCSSLKTHTRHGTSIQCLDGTPTVAPASGDAQL